jgi:hypothetical protein
VYVSFYQNYITSTLAELLEDKPILVTASKEIFPLVESTPSTSANFTGNTGTTAVPKRKNVILLPSEKDSEGKTVYVALDCSAREQANRWRLKIGVSEYSFYPKNLHTLLLRGSDDWKSAYSCNDIGSGYLSNGNPIFFMFEIEKLKEDEVNKFVSIVRILQTNEEYKRDTIFQDHSLASVLFKHPQLRTKRILQELMTREDLIEYATLTEKML